MKITVAQLGARRHYAVPVALQNRSMLDRFHTDFYAGAGAVGRTVDMISSVVPTSPLRRFTARQDASLDPRRVVPHPIFGLRYRMAGRRARSTSQRTATWMWGGRRFSELVAQAGFDDADAVYAYSSAALELFRDAHVAQRLCILDHATAPKTTEDALVARQYERYPGWARHPQSDAHAEAYTRRQRQECEEADLIICGSSFVRRMVQQSGVPGEKLVVVPLGLREMPDSPKIVSPADRPLRVLFAGDDALRKGLGDLVEAQKRLGPKACEVRVVGGVELTEHGRREAGRYARFIGRVPRQQMHEQYQWADVFVLPSVSDTFALVILEAMAHGVPVITTPNTGGPDVIDDGQDGWIVPIHAPESVAQRLLALRDDRHLLAAASEAAHAKAADYTMAAYADRLVQAIATAFGPEPTRAATRVT